MIRELFPHESRALSTTEAETQRMLNSAVKLRVSSRVTGAALEAEVQLVNHTGHKLPTAYPSRRMWLHLVLYDAKGVAVFESGSADPRTGEIVGLGEAGAPDFEPHFDVIASPGQVAVYEAELKDSSGNFTASLVRAAGYLKDNRILPRGFSRERSMLEGIDPGSLTSVGVEQDPNFGPGSDKVFYQMDLSDAGGPFRLIVEVYYQGIKPKHLKGMDKSNSGEEASLLDLFTRHRGPSLMARQELVIDQ